MNASITHPTPFVPTGVPTEISHLRWQVLVDALNRQLDNNPLNNGSQHWLREASDAIHSTCQAQDCDAAVEQLLSLSAMARRQLGRQRLNTHSLVLSGDGGWSDDDNWYTDDVARILLLVTLKTHITPDDWPDTLFRIYRHFDENEKIACLRALSWLAHDGDIHALALEATRANNVDVFSALALHNDYPHRYFQPRAFYQIVLKALFCGLNIQHIVGLPERQSLELTTLCADLVEEYQLAHRAVPESIWLGMRFQYLSKTAQETYQQFLLSGSPAHQHFALTALKINGTTDYPTALLAHIHTLNASNP